MYVLGLININTFLFSKQHGTKAMGMEGIDV